VRPHIFFDIGPAVHQRAGLARYAGRLATTLAANHAHEIDLTLVYNQHSGHRPPKSLADADSLALPLGQYAWRLSVLLSQLGRVNHQPLASRLKQKRDSAAGLALYHASEHLLPRLSCPTVLTVHDLIFEHYPQHHTRRNAWFLRMAMPLFVAAADAIIAVSQHTRSDLITLYHAPPEKIAIIYEGVDARFQPSPPERIAQAKARFSPDRPYLLMVGTLEPRKNHAAALRALARLKQWGHPHRLLIVGGMGWLFEPTRRLVEDLGLTGDVAFAGYAPDEELPALYSGADCVLLPSLFEGFGFPVLEAMACAAPVVCSNVSSLPEVAGDAALLAAPEDDVGLTHAIHLILSQPQLAERLRLAGLQQAARFRWDQCARETVELYRRLLRARTWDNQICVTTDL
jgi:glycosyltransferase involved in cell wall biosynthesis